MLSSVQRRLLQEDNAQSSLDIMYNYLQDHNFTNKTVDKIFQFAKRGGYHGISGGGQHPHSHNDLPWHEHQKLLGNLYNDQLGSEQRLVAWHEIPIKGYNYFPIRNGYLIFNDEHRDVANLIHKLDNATFVEDNKWLLPADDIIKGLAFGYDPSEVRDFACERDKTLTAYVDIKKLIPDIIYGRIEVRGDTIVVNIVKEDPADYDVLKRLGHLEYHNDHGFGKIFIARKIESKLC